MKNGLVGVFVGVFACIFVVAYILVFGSKPTSTNPEDWAHFATYLSGTVGVTAVLGTLFAVVRTLGQQQDLIDSQNKMLIKQGKQIEISENQLLNEKKSREVALVYENVKHILPMLMVQLERHVDRFVDNEAKVSSLFRKNVSEKHVIKNNDFFLNPYVLILEYKSADESLKIEIKNYIGDLLSNCFRIYAFLFDQLMAAPELLDAVDCYLDEEFKDGFFYARYYMLCALAYTAGCGNKDFVRKLMF